MGSVSATQNVLTNEIGHRKRTTGSPWLPRLRRCLYRFPPPPRTVLRGLGRKCQIPAVAVGPPPGWLPYTRLTHATILP